MSQSAETANVAFSEVCGGYLPEGASIGDRSQSVRGCNATCAGVGLWLIEPFDRTLNVFDDMLVLFNVAPKLTTAYGATQVLGPFVSNTGGPAPDFYIGTSWDNTPVELIDIALAFEVKRIPRNT